MSETYWNGEKCAANRVVVRVGIPPRDTWWFAGMEGTLRNAVEVNYQGETFLIDDEDGSGWQKVTEGRGGPRCRHRSLLGTVIALAAGEATSGER